MPSHHPQAEFLVNYAAGSLREPAALLIATHLALCPACRREVSSLEALGAAIFENASEVKENAQALNTLLARLLENLGAESHAQKGAGFSGKKEVPKDLAERNDDEVSFLPQPLRRYMPGGPTNLDWKGFGSMRVARLLRGSAKYYLTLCHIQAGAKIPAHTHRGGEMTLVLSGGLSDQNGHYLRGDFILIQDGNVHEFTADGAKDCFILVLTENRVIHTGPMGWFYNLKDRLFN